MIEKANQLARILVALDSPRRGHQYLQMAASLAVRRNLELLALFVEDIDLFNLADLPFTSEVDRLSAIERQLDSASISQIMASQAQQLRRMLSEITRQQPLQASLKIVRGRYIKEALSAAGSLDVVILGGYRGLSFRRHKLSANKASSKIQKPVWVLFDGTAVAKRALQVASDLAVSEPAKLNVVIPAAAKQDSTQLRKKTLEILRKSTLPQDYEILTLSDIVHLRDLIRGEAGSLVVIGRDNLEHLEEPFPSFSSFLDEMECGIVLVG